jgi:transposase, IS5 family
VKEALLATAADKVPRTHRVRAEPPLVAANLAYPTDAGLLAKAVGKLAATIGRIQAAGGATRTRGRDRRRAAHQLARSLRARTDQANQQLAELADLAEQAAPTPPE